MLSARLKRKRISKLSPKRKESGEKGYVGYQPPTLSVSWGFLINNKFCGLRSMWQTLWSRRYLSANASCCRNLRQTLSGSLCFFFMKLDKSPPSQYSMTMYICLFCTLHMHCLFSSRKKDTSIENDFLSVVRD